MSNIIKKEIDFAGKKLSLETGELAVQANLSVKATYGDTVVLATVVSADPNPDINYFPLSVQYQERMYASGSIKSSRFMKRDGRPTDDSVITRRLIDHAIRPLFPEGYMDDVQVIIDILSLDQDSDPVFLSMVAASAALHASNIPWGGPMATLRIGYENEKFILNPTRAQIEEASELDMIVSFVGKDKKFSALEAEVDLLPEEKVIEAIQFARDNIDPVMKLVEDFRSDVNPKGEKYEFLSSLPVQEVVEAVSAEAKDKVVALMAEELEKHELIDAKNDLLDALYVKFEGKFKKGDMEKAFYAMQKKAMQSLILDKGKRVDGRALDEIRDLSGSVGMLPRTHGSSLFTRGLTQVLTVATLGSPDEAMLIQDMYGERSKKYLHFYRFPPFSVGETGRYGFAGGREVGHGMLAEKALIPVLPSKEEFPYTMILQSETLSSNGSSSMASTCASSLSLMDAGVPIKEAVAGIGVGLIMSDDHKTNVVLTDLTGLEDGSGYLDFKMTGTRTGVTAIQVDMKSQGLDMELLPEIFERSKQARMKVLDAMESVLDKSREELSDYAPNMVTLKIQPDQIGMIIGSGGKVIKGIQEDTQTNVSIEDDGTVVVSGSKEGAAAAAEIIEGMTREVHAGEVFDGVVEEVVGYGAFVEILPGKTGLLHISEVSDEFVENIDDHVKAGDKFKVKVKEVSRDGKYSLTRKNVE